MPDCAVAHLGGGGAARARPRVSRGRLRGARREPLVDRRRGDRPIHVGFPRAGAAGPSPGGGASRNDARRESRESPSLLLGTVPPDGRGLTRSLLATSGRIKTNSAIPVSGRVPGAPLSIDRGRP